MKTSTKNSIITGTIALVCSAISIIGTNEYINSNQEQNQNITVNINGEEIPVDSKYIQNQETRITELEQVVNQLSNKKETVPESENDKDNTIKNEKTNEIYLNELSVYNFQSVNDGEWRSENIPEWKFNIDKTASGDTYKNAVKMRTTLNDAKSFVVDYYLQKKYTIFNGNYILDEESKSTPSVATLKIYGDGNILYEYNNITGGFPAQNTGNIDVTNVNILRFELTSESGGVGDYNNFGIVFYDTYLK